MKITVFDKNFKRLGTLGAATRVEFDPIANGAGTATVVIPASRPRVADAIREGARLVIDEPDVISFSGKVIRCAGSGPKGDEVSITAQSNWRLFNNLRAWPVPTAAIGAQGVAYRKYTGTAEKILKDAVRENATRAGLPVTVAPNLDRGNVISGGIQFRFHTLAERLFPLVEDAGLIATVEQVGSGLLVDVREIKNIRRPFTVGSGNLISYEWNTAAPTVTDVVVGGQGEGEARTLLAKGDATRRNLYGDRIEGFVDARDSDDPTELQTRMNETLLEGAPKSGLSLEVANTAGFTYGKHYQVGDRVTVKAGPLEIQEILRNVRFSWTRENGMTITPAVGERTDDPDLVLAKRVKALSNDLTNLKVR